MERKDKIILGIYGTLTLIIILFLSLNKWNAELLTRWLVIVFMGIQVLISTRLKKNTLKLSSKWKFILLATLFAMVVEGLHMISNPLDSSLLITAGMPLGKMLHNYFIDLVFTTPAYLIIFLVMWYFITKYQYALWEFVLIMGIGQALGDGFFFFLANPLLIVFIPYIALNYNAMNILPYLLVKDKLDKRSVSKRKYLPLIVLPLTYLITGFAIKIIAHWLKIF